MGGSGPAICSSDGHLRPSAPGRVFSPRLSGVTTEIRQEEELLEQKPAQPSEEPPKEKKQRKYLW